MEVIQEDSKVFLGPQDQIVDKCSSQLVDMLGWVSEVLDQGKEVFSDARELGPEGVDQVREEALEISIQAVNGVPADRKLGLMRQIDHQASLSVASGSRDQREWIIEQIIQDFCQAAAAEQIFPSMRDTDFCTRNSYTHGSSPPN